MNSPLLIPIAFRLILGALILVAIGWQLSIHVARGFDVVNFFSYFTNLANLFAAVVLLIGAGRLIGAAKPSPTADLLRGSAVVYMTVVGIVFTGLLRDYDLGALLPWINALLHYVVPVVLVLEWLVYPPVNPMTLRQLFFAQSFPLLYLAYVLIRGASTGWYPYPFLNPITVGGYSVVTMYVAGIIAVFFSAGWGLSKIRTGRPAVS